MKKLLFILFGLCVFAQPLIAQKGEMRLVPTAKPSIYKLYYSADISSDIKVTVRSSANESVFTRKIKDKNGFILPIDFSGFHSHYLHIVAIWRHSLVL